MSLCTFLKVSFKKEINMTLGICECGKVTILDFSFILKKKKDFSFIYSLAINNFATSTIEAQYNKQLNVFTSLEQY